jgi:hypothetical protein
MGHRAQPHMCRRRPGESLPERVLLHHARAPMDLDSLLASGLTGMRRSGRSSDDGPGSATPLIATMVEEGDVEPVRSLTPN